LQHLNRFVKSLQICTLSSI